MPLSIVYILLWLAEMGFAVVAAGACEGAAAGACPSTATGTADKAANRKESFLVTGMLLTSEITPPGEANDRPVYYSDQDNTLLPPKGSGE